MEAKMVKIAVLENEIEARLVESVLNDQGIPHMLKSYFDLVYAGVFQAHKGWGLLLAEEADRDRIEEVLRDLRKGYDWEEEEKA